MEYNSQFNPNYNNQFFNQNVVPPYPQPNSSNSLRTSDVIIESKDKEFSFVNSVLKNLVGKVATYYFSYPDSIKWRDMKYEGTLMAVGEDYIVIETKDTGASSILLFLYLEWIEYKGKDIITNPAITQSK